jgi:SAM-dependent methyltransferase
MASSVFSYIDKVFRKTDREHVLRTKNIKLIPGLSDRRGGKLSYAEWAHVIGIFQTIIYQSLENKTGNNILDIGCGTGLLAMSSQPFIYAGGTYTGIDVMAKEVAFCKQHYTDKEFNFVHFDVANPTYAENQLKEHKPWPVADESQDLVTALSVWTHLDENDALFYFKEIYRVLKTGQKAIVTFFYLNQDYKDSLAKREDGVARFHSTAQKAWIFDKESYGSKNWLTTNWAKYPEDAIGVTAEGMEMLIKESGLKLLKYYPGNWKEAPGMYFQDVLIFQK